MEPSILTISKSDMDIVNNYMHIKNEDHSNVPYENGVCVKPWGHEFLIYENKKIGMWFLNIKKNTGTSLHCHFNKDTYIIVLEGCAKITLINNEIRYINCMESIYIPKYKFHSIKSFSDNVIVLEIEIFSNTVNFSDKNDLLRIDDDYNRKPVGYESSVNFEKNNLENFQHFSLLENQIVNMHDFSIVLNTVKKTDELLSLVSNEYNILVSGNIFDNMIHMKEGSLININKDMQIDNTVSILSIKKNGWKDDSKIIYGLEHLHLVKDALCKKGKKIILTSGCFDIMHAGHIESLKNAKGLGDILMVCLSSDEQIKYLKGKTRPINTFNDRIKLFKTISYVDYIIPYDEQFLETEGTLGNIIKCIDPEYWVKGADYTLEQIREKHPYIRNVKLIGLVENKSTTSIIQQLQKESALV